jgi:hypothetical protein
VLSPKAVDCHGSVRRDLHIGEFAAAICGSGYRACATFPIETKNKLFCLRMSRKRTLIAALTLRQEMSGSKRTRAETFALEMLEFRGAVAAGEEPGAFWFWRVAQPEELFSCQFGF